MVAFESPESSGAGPVAALALAVESEGEGAEAGGVGRGFGDGGGEVKREILVVVGESERPDAAVEGVGEAAGVDGEDRGMEAENAAGGAGTRR